MNKSRPVSNARAKMLLLYVFLTFVHLYLFLRKSLH
jgi:hypothetical protein